jgi:anhydro-N-acetylmuramic acid kinase
MENRYLVTGLMSGSSMDGVDLACCELLMDNGEWEYRILEAETIPYNVEHLSKLEVACNWNRDRIAELDRELGIYFAGLLNDFHKKHQLAPEYIASHGHTILHDPNNGITLQAGDGSLIAEMTGITVINDFRSEDVRQGGQGAPLVPLGDRLLFPGYEGCLNLGGFANISCEDEKGTRLAYDLCPANMALNWVAALEGRAYDHNGEMAARGELDKVLLHALNELDFYAADPPKSLGREWFLEHMVPLMQQSALRADDLMATVSAHIAYQISSGVNDAQIQSLLITGGGALNQTLIRQVMNHTPATLHIPDETLIHYKEALIFALLGILRIRGEINCLASVTGGKEDLSAGTIHKP